MPHALSASVAHIGSQLIEQQKSSAAHTELTQLEHPLSRLAPATHGSWAHPPPALVVAGPADVDVAGPVVVVVVGPAAVAGAVVLPALVDEVPGAPPTPEPPLPVCPAVVTLALAELEFPAMLVERADVSSPPAPSSSKNAFVVLALHAEMNPRATSTAGRRQFQRRRAIITRLQCTERDTIVD